MNFLFRTSNSLIPHTTRLRPKRGAEGLMYGIILVAGILFGFLHLFPWATPRWMEHQRFPVIPVSLIVIGVIGLGRQWITPWIHRRVSVAQQQTVAVSPLSSLPTVPDTGTSNDSPGTHLAFRLPVVQHSVMEQLGALGFCVFWNILSWGVLLYLLYHSAHTLFDFVYCGIFGLLFCGFGLFLFITVLHQLMSLFSVGPTILEISNHPVVIGRRFRLMFIQYGAFRIQELDVSLLCEEIARFRQDTDTVSVRKKVYHKRLMYRRDFETTSDTPLQHEFVVRLPSGAMHSFRTNNHEIVWKILVRAKLLGWMDLHQESVIIVYPATTSHTER